VPKLLADIGPPRSLVNTYGAAFPTSRDRTSEYRIGQGQSGRNRTILQPVSRWRGRPISESGASAAAPTSWGERGPAASRADDARLVGCDQVMRAAMAALQYEHPRLAVVAQINESSFAEVLERRLKNMERINNGNAKMIEAKQVETKTPMPRLGDRRYRRV
jgi:hypothetical protein